MTQKQKSVNTLQKHSCQNNILKMCIWGNILIKSKLQNKNITKITISFCVRLTSYLWLNPCKYGCCFDTTTCWNNNQFACYCNSLSLVFTWSIVIFDINKRLCFDCTIVEMSILHALLTDSLYYATVILSHAKLASSEHCKMFLPKRAS